MNPYTSCFMTVSFIAGGNRSSLEKKPPQVTDKFHHIEITLVLLPINIFLVKWLLMKNKIHTWLLMKIKCTKNQQYLIRPMYSRFIFFSKSSECLMPLLNDLRESWNRKMFNFAFFFQFSQTVWLRIAKLTPFQKINLNNRLTYADIYVSDRICV